MSREQLISIIIPAYNEAPNLRLLYDELAKHCARLRYRFEILFVNDGSSDNSAQILSELDHEHEEVRALHLSRNFGKEAAMTAGLHQAKGDAALIIDADLQMPPRLMGEFVQKWEQGNEVVVGVFAGRKMSYLHKLGSRSFYRIMQAIAQTKITPHATDFRLLDRKVINEFNRLTEHNRNTRGLVDWLGFQRSYVYFKQEERLHGQPTYNFRKLTQLAINSFISHSLVPLKLAGYLGGFILTITAPTGIALYVERYIMHDPLHLGINSTTMLALLTVFLIGLVLACMGLVSLYIAHIHAEVTNRPLYIIRNHPATQTSSTAETETEEEQRQRVRRAQPLPKFKEIADA